jgi:hypothetical protein
MRQESIDFIRRRFVQQVCPVLGWNCAPFYIRGDQGLKPNHGAVQIEKVYGRRWRVVQLCENSTGERNLSDAYTKGELLAWMEGLLVAAKAMRHV